MALSHERVVALGETEYPHEQEGIAFAREALPDTDPYLLWGLIDLLDPTTGRLHEIDLLVLGYSCLYLVELKAYSGRMEGDALDWTWTGEDGRRRARENPRRLTRRKAQILKSRLERQLPPGIRCPWIEPLTFLSHESIKLDLTPAGLVGVVRRDNFARAITRHDYPGADARLQGKRIDVKTQRAVVQGLKAIGFRERKGKRHAGSYELGELTGETDSYQDREATHRDIRTQKARARTYLVPEQTSIERRQQLRRAADREAQLLYEVREHPGILRLIDYVADAPLGPTVLFDAFDDGIPLGAFLRKHPELPFSHRIALIEQIGRALDHCHKKQVVHGGLCPAAVLVRERNDGPPEARLENFLLGQSGDVSATSHWTELAAPAWALYQAPEAARDPAQRTAEADVFSLGALAFTILTGAPPAADLGERARVLRERRCLDPRTLDESVPEGVAQAVAFASHEVIAQRADDAGDWIELLVDAATEPERAPEADISPLVARQGDTVGPYEVRSILGTGASSRVLEVTDADGRSFALKASLSADNDERLHAEAEVLRTLHHHRIVRLHDELTLGGRTCLVLSLAGDRTLYRELANQGSIGLDYASRWGEDLLSALEHLEENEVIHRDIKPDNIGVGAVAKKALSLHLFDFSLASAPLTSVRVGTTAYRDPGLLERGRWDHAADRFSAALTLHELLTGVRPTLGDDATFALSAERFDPSVRTGLVAFFQRALAPAVADRHDSAVAMRREWIAVFDTRAAAPDAAAADTDERPSDDAIRAITPDTAIAALPLSTRAKNALDRAGLLRARDLLGLPQNRLSGVRGVGRKVAAEIHDLRQRWQRTLDLAPETGPAFFPGYCGDDLLVAATLAPTDARALSDAGFHTLAQIAAAPAAHIRALAAHHALDADAVLERLRRENEGAGVREHPTTLEGWVEALFAGKKKPAAHVRALFGLEGPLAGRLGTTPAELAEELGLSRQAVYIALSKAAEGWSGHPALPVLADRLRAHLVECGGAAKLARLADWLLSELPHTDAAPDHDRARAAALCRAIVEADRSRDDGLRFARIADQPWVVADTALLADLRELGAVADRFAARDTLAGPGETERALRQVVNEGSPLSTLDADRLVRLAADASSAAAASPRLELYPRGMSSVRALTLSAAALGPGLSPDDLRARVAARYPAAAKLPPRTELDTLVTAIGLRFDPANDIYVRPGDRSQSSVATRVANRTRTSQLTPQTITERDVAISDFDDRLRAALARRSLLVLGVTAELADQAARALSTSFDLRRESFDARFLAALDAEVAAQGIDPEVVIETDFAGAADDAWPLLREICRDAAARVATELFPPDKPLLITEPGLIDRFGLTDFLEQMLKASEDDDAQALVLLCPGRQAGTPTIEGRTPIPGLLPGQASWVPQHWLSARG